jgi:hypothetical protein
MVSGRDKPLKANREFELVAEVTVTFAFAATRFPDKVSLLPTVTLPKENDVGAMVNSPWVAVPVPLTVSVTVDGFALLVKLSVALAAPAACGLKLTVNCALCPSAIVTGSDKPVTEKAELLLLIFVTVTLAPEAVRLSVSVALFPTLTLPKLYVVGVIDSSPEVLVPVPTPMTVSMVVDGFPLLLKVRVPLAVPLA